MTFWIDAHLSPLIAAWLTWTFADVQAVPLRDLGLRDAEDEEIFQAAKAAGVVVLTKRRLPPPARPVRPAATGALAHLRQYLQRAAARSAARHYTRRAGATSCGRAAD